MFQTIRECGNVLFFIGLVLFAFPTFSQDKNIEGVQKRANELFEQKKYQEAKELYSQLVSLYPKDENFNYRFGACLMFVDEDKTYPLKFLEYAVSKPNVDIEAFYFLGKGYHYNYRFDEAILYFNKYKSKLDVKVKSKYPVDNDIRYCENGKSLLKNISSPLVLKRSKVSAADFFTSFKLSEMGGRMLYAPKELHSAVDKRKGYSPVMYKNANSNVVYYSSYGNTEKNGLDIYKVDVSDYGVIGKPVKLPETINTKFDERFPFLTENGTQFYFSSTGHNSMGGADIFSARVDTNSGVIGLPVNLDYSVNTPDDDFMYAEVGVDGIAYFASNRNCEKGKAYVYKIDAERRNFQIAVIAGVFNSKDTRSCKVTVEDLDEHKVVGTFHTDKKSGEYVMRLKNGGKYSFLVEPYGGQIAYKGRVDLPTQTEIKLLKQEIQIVEEEGTERLIIRNLFEQESVPGDEVILAQAFVDNANIEEEKEAEITITNQEIVDDIEQIQKEKEEQIQSLEIQKEKSFLVANTKRELAHKDLDLADQLEKQISINEDSEENKKKQRELVKLVEDAKIHTQEAEAAYKIGEKYEEQIVTLQKDLNKTEGYLIRIKNASQEDSRIKVVKLYTDFQNQETKSGENQLESVIDNNLGREKELMNREIKKSETLAATQETLKQEIKTEKSRLLATKKKNQKADIQTRITNLEIELEPLEQEKVDALKKANSHEEKINSLTNEKVLLAEIRSGANNEVSVDSKITAEQKVAMLASIEATSNEIEALESSVKETYNSNENELGSNNEETSVEEELIANEVTNESELENEPELVVDTSPIDTTVSEQLAEVTPNVTEPEGQEQEEEIESNQDPETNVENPEQTEIEASTIVNQNPESVFEYSNEYETPVEDIVVVEGENIPLEITSNTGKLKYTNGELKDANVILDESAYHASFQEEFEENKNIENKSERAQQAQRINYGWVVAIEKEIAELSYAKQNSNNEAFNSRLDDKISELNDQASQKRNYMALNARIIKQLGQEESIVAESTSEESVIDSTLNSDTGSEIVQSEAVGTSTQDSETNESEVIDENNNIPEEGTSLPSDSNLIVATETELDNENLINPFENSGEAPATENLNKENSELDENTIPQESLSTNEVVTNQNNIEQNINEEEASANSVVENVELANNQSASGNESNIEEELNEIENSYVVPDPSEMAITEIETKKEIQVTAVVIAKNERTELQAELERTKKKKEKRKLVSQIQIKEAEVAYEERKLELIDQKINEAKLSQDKMVEDPLSTRPSEEKFAEARKISYKTNEFQSELEDLELRLSQTKKKKHRRVIEAEIINVKKEIKMSKLESEMATESAQEMEDIEIETLKKLTPYGLEELIKLPKIENEISVEQMAQVETIPAYLDYVEVKTESAKEIQEAAVLYESSNDKKKEVAQLEEEISLLNEGLTLLPENEKIDVQNEIIEKREKQKRLIAEAEVQYQEAKATENEAYYNLNEANSELLVLDNTEEKTLILAALNGKIEAPVVVFDSSNIDAIPTDLTTDIFVDNDSTFYGDAKPIPVGVTLPRGVILKVQIGAFRNPINQSTFKGFAPIVGEITASGLTRYTAGLFKDFEMADNAKSNIRAKGYSDAFVVAYLDGKRISISEARRVLSGEIQEADVVTNTVTNTPVVVEDEVNFSVNEINSRNIQPGEGDVQVVESQERGELFFTIQVGVYNNRVQPSSVFSISPLNSESIANNLVRYSSGVYGSISKASVARNRIVQDGIRDAFVTAYYNGKRIPLSEARLLIANGTVVSEGNGTNMESSGSTTNPQENSNGINVASPDSNDNGGFYVQIGPYQDGIPVEQAKQILELNTLGVVVEKNNNATLYKIGNFTTRVDAETLKNDLEVKGLINPTVVENER